MPGSINLSLLYAGHANDLHIKTACGPPRNFRHASTCPRIDRQASGLAHMTTRTFNTSFQNLHDLQTCWFPFGSFFQISLRHVNKLSGPFFKTYDTTSALLLVQGHRCPFLQKRDPFMPHPTITYHFQALFNTFQGLLFSFRSRYYFAIGFAEYLVLEVDDPQIHAGFPTHATQVLASGKHDYHTGLSPCIVRRSSRLLVPWLLSLCKSSTPHVLPCERKDSV